MDKVRQHFDDEAAEFDSIIQRIIPFYEQMLDALADTLTFGPEQEIRVLDLGCGTGSVGERVAKRFPRARITSLDFSDQMLDMAKRKLGESSSREYVCQDLQDFQDIDSFDAIVSSLALHHLETDDDKEKFYKVIHQALRENGVFVNADVILGSSDAVQNVYMEHWREFMLRSVPAWEIEEVWLPKYREEDRPVSLMKHVDWLRNSGFETVDVVWKYYNFAVYGAWKTAS